MKRIMFLICILGALGNSAFAAETENKSVESMKSSKPSTEMRQKMAERHDKMASCLRSERPISECRQEMMQGCEDAMGKEGCLMMGGKMRHGMHHMMDKQENGKK